MSERLAPVSRTELIRKLRALGYDGPFAGGKHQYMAVAGKRPIHIPNPHQGDIGVALLQRILKQADIDRDSWNRA